MPAARTCAFITLVAMRLFPPSAQFVGGGVRALVLPSGAERTWSKGYGARAHLQGMPARQEGGRCARVLVRTAASGAGRRASDRAGGQSGFPSTAELNPFRPGSREGEMAEALMQSLQVDDAQQRLRIEQAPQGSREWLDARKYRLTASNFGAAAGRNRFRSPEQLVQDMLYGEFKGNDATRWGSQMESVALDAYVARKQGEIAAGGGDQQATISQKTSICLPLYEKYTRVMTFENVWQAFRVTQSGLHVCAQAGWLAASPDGHVHEGSTTGLLEIKCPYSKRLYPSIPDYYMDQACAANVLLMCCYPSIPDYLLHGPGIVYSS
jgi:hypothetical protein